MKETEYLEKMKGFEANPALYKNKLRDVFSKRGFSPKETDLLVNTISTNSQTMVEFLMFDEDNQEDTALSPTKSALYTFLSFTFFGVVPLVADVFITLGLGIKVDGLISACLLTGATLFILGALRGRYTKKNQLQTAIEMVTIGGFAAIVAYVIGYALSGLKDE
eukprot:TRINITY_DN4308_c0_g1_i1.p1 TRINITY_DN4308_c0_g1~~TRINITY_DN4308_c0_g1_i1.p1  ORF type:complete len:192 (+),score=42.49 TRINITY_DN4308_c0_g1_i1:85-576(+)